MTPADLRKATLCATLCIHVKHMHPNHTLQANVPASCEAHVTANIGSTQGVSAELQPRLAAAVAHAAGRYGHVMFPENAHQPALDVASKLLAGVGSGWASRAFFSDDGSAPCLHEARGAIDADLASQPTQCKCRHELTTSPRAPALELSTVVLNARPDRSPMRCAQMNLLRELGAALIALGRCVCAAGRQPLRWRSRWPSARSWRGAGRCRPATPPRTARTSAGCG